MKFYKIIAQTNGWIAQRSGMFNGHCQITIKENMSLKEAYVELLDLFNHYYNTSYQNWGLCVANSNYMACPTFSDCTRSFEWDSRYFIIEEMKSEEEKNT